MSLGEVTVNANPTTPLRTSSYTIYVDLKDDRENTLLVHGYTGAFDLVSRRVAGYLRLREKTKSPKPLYGDWSDDSDFARLDGRTPAQATLALLERRGYLTAMTVEEEQAYFTAQAGSLHTAARLRMPTYVVMPTYDCNLRCGYCFQDHMRTDASFSHLRRLMTTKIADRIIAALPQFEVRHEIGAENISSRPFIFFGGEPLLGQSLPIVEYFIDKARSAGPATFSAVTNGTQLHAFERLLGPGKIDSLQITLDGPPSRHDARRIHADGSGSFEAIARNITMALERGVRIAVRTNVDRGNVSDLPELAGTFDDRGWTAFANFTSYAEPVTDTAFGNPGRRAQLFNSYELNEEIALLRRAFSSMAAIGTHDDALTQRARRIFERDGDERMRMTATFCRAHSGMYILDPFGDVYACWERTGDRNIRIGWIDESGTLQFVDERQRNWRERSVVSNPTCRRCRFALYCGGGCAVLAEAANGATMHANYCDAFGKRFRAKVAEAYAGYASDKALQSVAAATSTAAATSIEGC